MPPASPLPDPETLLIIGLIGGAVGAASAVGTFVLYQMAVRLGPEIQSPPFIAELKRSLEGAAN